MEENMVRTLTISLALTGVAMLGVQLVLTKGPVSLALAGHGEGIDLGVSVGEFILKPAK
jgi:hypothetical protein